MKSLVFLSQNHGVLGQEEFSQITRTNSCSVEALGWIEFSPYQSTGRPSRCHGTLDEDLTVAWCCYRVKTKWVTNGWKITLTHRCCRSFEQLLIEMIPASRTLSKAIITLVHRHHYLHLQHSDHRPTSTRLFQSFHNTYNERLFYTAVDWSNLDSGMIPLEVCNLIQ